MSVTTINSNPDAAVAQVAAPVANWILNATLLWNKRRELMLTAVVSFAISLAIAFALPKRYESSASIMPPDQGSGGAALLAALGGRGGGGLGGLGSLAGSLLGGHNTSALFEDLLHSGTVGGRIIDRFHLQQAYHKRYRVDAAKYLAHHTTIANDKKTGVITISVEDTDPVRARDITQAYLEELNRIVSSTDTSTARQERLFIERRLTAVQNDLEHAQLALSDFSSTHATIDIKEQTHAMVDAAAKLQGELIVGQSEVGSLQQIYGDANVRVRAAQARVGALQHQLTLMSGTDAQLSPPNANPVQGGGSIGHAGGTTELYPPLRQLPRLAVPYADLYRSVRVQETVFELLTQEYEMARIQEAKDVPVISVIDAPGIPEKKSYPPRLIVALVLTIMALLAVTAIILMREAWDRLSDADPKKILLLNMQTSLLRKERA